MNDLHMHLSDYTVFLNCNSIVLYSFFCFDIAYVCLDVLTLKPCSGPDCHRRSTESAISQHQEHTAISVGLTINFISLDFKAFVIGDFI